MRTPEADASLSDGFLDEIFGQEVDWRELVTRYPKLALALAAGGGLMVGLRHGPALLEALSDALGARAAAAIRSATEASGADEDESDEELEDRYEAEGAWGDDEVEE